jgi:outer membrane lipoprotein-sorting protein
MKCLSQKQIERLALGMSDDTALAAHLDECDACRTNLESLRSLVRQLSEGHAKFDLGHNAAREQLLAILLTASRPPETVGAPNRINQLFGGLTMRQRIVLSGASVAGILAILLFWIGSFATPVLAMEKMAENIRKAKSFRATLLCELEGVAGPDNKKNTSETTGMIYWKAPDVYRVEAKVGRNASGMDSIKIYSRSKPGIEIDRTKKEYRRQPAEQGPPMPLMMIDKLGEYRGQAEKDLGAKEMGDAKVQGFVVDSQKIDPDSSADSKVEIWTDTQSNLPVQIIFTMKMAEDAKCTMRMENIQWNIDLDPQLFSTTPPEGYVEASIPQPESPERQLQHIIDALRIYAELTGDHYPRVKRIYGDQIMFEVRKMIGADTIPSQEQMRDEKVRKEFMEKYMKAQKASFGMGIMTRILRDNPDAAYYGKTVTPKDKDKVLLRWKLDDGKYEVIFGDLRAETVTAERLRELEGK